MPFVTFGRPWGGVRPATPGSTSTAPPAPRRPPGTCSRQGHRRIGFLGWPEGSGVGDDRQHGWATRDARRPGCDSPGSTGTPLDGVAEGERVARDLLRPAATDRAGLRQRPARPRRPRGAGRTCRSSASTTRPMAQAAGLSSVRQPLAEAAADLRTTARPRLLGQAGPRDRTRPTTVLLEPRPDHPRPG